MVDNVLFSSAVTTWGTPTFLFQWLNGIYRFDLDACASHNNFKCERYFTEEEDGLKRDWSYYADSVFMNPPYGNSEHPCKPGCKKKKCLKRGYHIDRYIPGIEDWVRKAHQESLMGIDVVCLIPARTDTISWWHKHCMKSDRIDFIVGRLSFTTGDSSERAMPAPFPSAIVYFLGKTKHGKHPHKPVINSLFIDKKTKEIIVV